MLLLVRQFSDGRRGVALAAGLGVAWLVFYGAWLALRPGGEGALTLFSNTAYLVPIAAATGLAVAAALRSAPGLRRFWGLMAVSNALWLGAEAVWSARELTTGSVPFPWWTDVGYLASYAILPIALYVAFRPRLVTVSPARLLDGAIVVAALALVWGHVVLGPLELEANVVAAVGLAYPTLGLVLIGMLVALRLLPVRHGTVSMRLVGAGVACSAVADGLYTHAAVTHSYLSGDWIAIGWQAEAVLFAIAAFIAVRRSKSSSDWARFRDTREIGSRTVVTGGLATVVAALASETVEHSPWLVGGSLALAVLLALRMWLLLVPRARTLELTDPKTGTYNAEYYEDQLERLAGRARHFGESFAVALVETDAYAAENESLDLRVADRLVRGSRDVDVVAHLEDGRFGVLIPNVDADEALAVGERIRREVATRPLRTDRGLVSSTVSLGVAVWARDDDAAALAKKAHAALAAAQRLGGNQVRTGPDDRVLFGDGGLDGERLDAIVRLARLVDAREGDDLEHSGTVAAIASLVALEMGLDADTVSRTYVAGLLHDLGKLALPEGMLEKPGPLDESEWDEMARHPTLGASLAAKITSVRDAAPIIAAHHERWDGAGYPLRVRGTRIPAEARIVAVADALVAITSDRPYRRAQSETSALTTIWRESGTRYDPAVVSALLTLARDGRLGLPERVADEGTRVRAPVVSDLAES
jgi:two-component system, cell cycle response regulator